MFDALYNDLAVMGHYVTPASPTVPLCHIIPASNWYHWL